MSETTAFNPSEELKTIIERARQRNHENIVKMLDRSMDTDDDIFLLLAPNFPEYLTRDHLERLASLHPNEEIRQGLRQYIEIAFNQAL